MLKEPLTFHQSHDNVNPEPVELQGDGGKRSLGWK